VRQLTSEQVKQLMMNGTIRQPQAQAGMLSKSLAGATHCGTSSGDTAALDHRNPHFQQIIQRHLQQQYQMADQTGMSDSSHADMRGSHLQIAREEVVDNGSQCAQTSYEYTAAQGQVSSCAAGGVQMDQTCTGDAPVEPGKKKPVRKRLPKPKAGTAKNMQPAGIVVPDFSCISNRETFQMYQEQARQSVSGTSLDNSILSSGNGVPTAGGQHTGLLHATTTSVPLGVGGAGGGGQMSVSSYGSLSTFQSQFIGSASSQQQLSRMSILDDEVI